MDGDSLDNKVNKLSSARENKQHSLLYSCVIWGKLLKFSVPCKCRIQIVPISQNVMRKWMRKHTHTHKSPRILPACCKCYMSVHYYHDSLLINKY